MGRMIKIQTAMFVALGSITKLSRSGYSIVFAKPVFGRNDLMTDEQAAIEQAREAGLDFESVTQEQISVYQTWHSNMYETRRIGPDARFLITRKFPLKKGSRSEPGNRVTLIDGWGVWVASADFHCVLQWDSQAINCLSKPGAITFDVDYKRINSWIEEMRKRHPEFNKSRILDNNIK